MSLTRKALAACALKSACEVDTLVRADAVNNEDPIYAVWQRGSVRSGRQDDLIVVSLAL